MHGAMSNAPELPKNVASRKTTSRCWNGVNIDLHEFHCTGRILFEIEQKDEESSRLVAQLEEVGNDRAEARTAPNTPNPHLYKPRPMFFVPARMHVWGHSADSRYIRCATISFDANALHERLGLPRSLRLLDVPRLRFNDDRLWTLIRLLAEAIDDSDPGAQLYGDSLTAAIASRLLKGPTEVKGRMAGLSALQLKDAMGYLEAKMPAKVGLATLAQLAGLSQSHYNRAFKASTGLAPYQWQLQARIEHAKDLLLNTNGRLEEVAEATGFADAVHFGRTFRKITGATPAAWRLDRLT